MSVDRLVSENTRLSILTSESDPENLIFRKSQKICCFKEKFSSDHCLLKYEVGSFKTAVIDQSRTKISRTFHTAHGSIYINRVASDTGMYWDVLHVLGKKLCTEKRLFFISVLGNVLGFFFGIKRFTRKNLTRHGYAFSQTWMLILEHF